VVSSVISGYSDIVSCRVVLVCVLVASSIQVTFHSFIPSVKLVICLLIRVLFVVLKLERIIVLSIVRLHVRFESRLSVAVKLKSIVEFGEFVSLAGRFRFIVGLCVSM